MRTRSTDAAENLRQAVWWVTESKAQKWRHDRAMAFLFATMGAGAFPGCETLLDVCDRCDLSERTMFAHLEVLRTAFGIRPPSALPSDVPVDRDKRGRKEGAAPSVTPSVVDDDEFAADEDSEAA